MWLDSAKLRRALAIRGVGPRDFAGEAGIHPQTLYAALSDRPISMLTARRIALALERVPEVDGLVALVLGDFDKAV